MKDDSSKLAGLLDFVEQDGRVCPQPQQWMALWEMLPGRQRVGIGWNPPLPIVLSAWWYTGALDKRLRLREHIKYAAQSGALDAVDEFLRGLTTEQWHTMRDS